MFSIAALLTFLPAVLYLFMMTFTFYSEMLGGNDLHNTGYLGD